VFLGDHLHLHGLQVEASLLESLDNLVDETTLDAVRLNHDVSSFHIYVFCMCACACAVRVRDDRNIAAGYPKVIHSRQNNNNNRKNKQKFSQKS